MDERVLSRMDAPALREYIRCMLEKKGKPCGKKQSDEKDKEREDLSDLHEETKGKPPTVPVSDDDMPFDLGGEDEEKSGDDDSQADEPVPPKRKGK